MLRRGGRVLGWRGAVDRCRRRGDGCRKRERRDRGRGGDDGDHGDDGDGDLRRRERGRRGDGGEVELLAVRVIAPGDVVGSDRLGR